MSKYDVNFNITALELLPVLKRPTDDFSSDIYDLAKSLNEPLNVLSLIYKYYREGSSAGNYNPLTVYAYGELVNYQRRVYFRNEITSGYVAGIAPNNTTYFVKVLDDTIGLNDRIRFGNGKLILEYALNATFGTSFNQPPVLSDIYITRNSGDSDTFAIGELDSDTATISENDTDADWGIPETEPSVASPFDYVIHIPTAVWTALASTNNERDMVVLSVASKYKLFGYLPEIQTY